LCRQRPRRLAAELKRKEALAPEYLEPVLAPRERGSPVAKIGAVIGFIIVMRMMMKIVFYFFR
jgi:hypothetical protein